MCNPTGCGGCCKKATVTADNSKEVFAKGFEAGFLVALMSVVKVNPTETPTFTHRRRPRTPRPPQTSGLDDDES